MSEERAFKSAEEMAEFVIENAFDAILHSPLKGEMKPVFLKKTGLSSRKICVLMIKREHPDFGARKIANILDEYPAAVAKDLERLKKFGYL